MKQFRLSSLASAVTQTVACISILAFSPALIHAGPDAARVAGDLKVDGIHFSVDGSVQTKASPWGYGALNGFDIGFMNNVGIGKLDPSTKLDVAGTVTATQFVGDGTGLSGVQKKYAKVAVVAKSGGDYNDPRDALINLATWCGTPTSTDRCLLKIMPGVYDISPQTLFMIQYVDYEGSGEELTIITSAVSNVSYPPAMGVVNGANDAEIHHLTISNTKTTGSYIAAFVNNGSSPKISNITVISSGAGGADKIAISNYNSSTTMNNVTASASGGINFNIGVNNYNTSNSLIMNNVTASATGGSNSYGVQNTFCSPVMNNVTVTASGATNSNSGIYNYSSSPTMTNVITSGTGGTSGYGMYNYATSGSRTIIIDRSTFEGSTNSIRNDTVFTLQIGASKLVGPVNALGTYIYSGAYDNTGTVTAEAFSGDGAGLTNVNAASVTDGVYTNGAYANPAWITSLAGSKLTGTVAVANGGTGATTAPLALTGLGAVAKAGDTMSGALGLPVLVLPATTNSTNGVINSGGVRLIHTFGTNNFFAGESAGNFTMSGTGGNTGIGVNALLSNTTGAYNTALGMLSLRYNDTGVSNTAVGFNAGGSSTNTTGSNNTFIGVSSGPGTAVGLINATAIGYGATVGQSNSLVLGGTGANAVKVGIGTTTPGTYLDVTNSMRVTGVPVPTWAPTGQGLEMAYDSDSLKGYIQAYNRSTPAWEALEINASTVFIGGTSAAPGHLNVKGALTKGSGTFKIDHPLDPRNKFLYHSFVESPDMMNIYNGNVTTDDRGYATIDLPDWFEALNREFRYQLTVIDENDSVDFVQAKVVKGVSSNRFTVRTSVPATTISWQVTGIRKDAFAEKHRVKVEEDKTAEEKGTCLHPEACE